MCEHAVSSIHLLNICIIWHPLHIFVRMCAWGSFVMIYHDNNINNKTKFISTHWVEHATVERTYIFCAAAFKWNGGMFSSGSWMCPQSFCFCWMNYIRISMKPWSVVLILVCPIGPRWTQPFELVLFCPPHLRSYPKDPNIFHPLKTWIDETLMKLLPYWKGHASSCFVSYICSVNPGFRTDVFEYNVPATSQGT